MSSLSTGLCTEDLDRAELELQLQRSPQAMDPRRSELQLERAESEFDGIGGRLSLSSIGYLAQAVIDQSNEHVNRKAVSSSGPSSMSAAIHQRSRDSIVGSEDAALRSETTDWNADAYAESWPSADEMAQYLEKHNLQGFLHELMLFVARHLPPDPFDFLLSHVQDFVRRHRVSAAEKARELGMGPSPILQPQPSQPTAPIPVELSAEQKASIVKHITAAFQNPEVTRTSAAKLFARFAQSNRWMRKEDFAKVLRHWESTWGLPADEAGALVEVLKRWRFRANAACGKSGLPLWPLEFEDFVSAYPNLLLAMRDRYAPLGGMMNRSLFIRQAAGVLADKYDLGPGLGRGAYGEVVLVTLRSTRERRVCKRVRKQQQMVPSEQFVDEVNVLRNMDHPHIIRIFEYFETEQHIEMIMEPVFGGTLAQLVQRLYPHGQTLDAHPPALSEVWLATVMSQLLGALTYAHEIVGVIHKDLKSENVLLVGRPGLDAEEILRQPAHTMLADFGIAEVFSPDPHNAATGFGAGVDVVLRLQSRRVGGTPAYMSPEMFKGSFTEKADVWSLGVVLFCLMTGTFPYRGTNLFAQAYKVSNAREHPQWELATRYKWSLGARLFCQRLLSKEESLRPSAFEASRDDWVVKLKVDAEVTPEEGERTALRHQHLQSHLLTMARHCVTSQLSLSPLHHLNTLFRQYDRDGNGRLNHLEMRQVLDEIGIRSGEDVELIIESLDSNRSGLIEYSEFIAGCIDLASDDMRKHLRAVFDVFDLDGSGAISAEELRQVLTQGANSDGVVASPSSGAAVQHDQVSSLLPDGTTSEEVLGNLDVNGSGQVEYEEFERYILAEHARSMRGEASVSCCGPVSPPTSPMHANTGVAWTSFCDGPGV